MVRVAAAGFRHSVPITTRGGGTGNCRQAVPLEGGVVLDMTGLDGIEWQRPGMLRVALPLGEVRRMDLAAWLQPGPQSGQ